MIEPKYVFKANAAEMTRHESFVGRLIRAHALSEGKKCMHPSSPPVGKKRKDDGRASNGGRYKSEADILRMLRPGDWIGAVEICTQTGWAKSTILECLRAMWIEGRVDREKRKVMPSGRSVHFYRLKQETTP